MKYPRWIPIISNMNVLERCSNILRSYHHPMHGRAQRRRMKGFIVTSASPTFALALACRKKGNEQREGIGGSGWVGFRTKLWTERGLCGKRWRKPLTKQHTRGRGGRGGGGVTNSNGFSNPIRHHPCRKWISPWI